MSVRLTAISPEPLDVATHMGAVSDSGTGAVASFIGTVRDHSPDANGTVTRLEYSAHPDAPRVLAELADRVAGRHPDVALAVSHRTGDLAVGDLAIVACAGSAHRAAAFDACRDLVEVVKAELPMWKKQFLADGSHTWVGSA
ncbi:molybdenum cofactor biosynthesis protein MoaE [Occultella glacieicola]|uniref:Molybdenum cofactor biosynthesis protein MoaE n=1 Tax=Occultella glacieicola TaxID=2518684 RepID=A0ABY2E4Q4_9MICO|nr:molybdenum cofactor biosynthesis protein MoaE [Occultella glacieicola]TDE94188.1 molybdenum cofactor biosynthesis protein MoaE [Occultella glacieicola]